MTDRKFPNHCTYFLQLAESLELSCPLGRALYACNRVQNLGYGDTSRIGDSGDDHGVAYTRKFLRAIKPSTAERWLAHWQNGGHIKVISLSSVEYNKRRRAQDAARKARYGKLPVYKQAVEAALKKE
jgi:hypothetical protein